MTDEEIRRGIEQNYELTEVVKKQALKERDTERRLSLISLTGLLYSVLQTGLYSSDELEEEIRKYSQNWCQVHCDGEVRKYRR